MKKSISLSVSMENLEKLKKDKRALKSSLNKCLNELAVELSLEAQKEENYGAIAGCRKEAGRTARIF